MSNASAPCSLPTEVAELLPRLGVPRGATTGGSLPVGPPVTGEQIAAVAKTSTAEAIGSAHTADLTWRNVPGPRYRLPTAPSTTTRAEPVRSASTRDAAGAALE